MELLEFYTNVKSLVVRHGYSWEIENVIGYLNNPCANEKEFFKQYLWVVLNAGMRYQVAVQIYHRILSAFHFSYPIETAFKNKKKTDAILLIANNKKYYWQEYQNAKDKLSFLESLPFIGSITKYHLARNLGLNCCKPDRHLVRIANQHSTTPEKLCRSISDISGDMIGVVDVVLWRAANLRLI